MFSITENLEGSFMGERAVEIADALTRHLELLHANVRVLLFILTLKERP